MSLSLALFFSHSLFLPSPLCLTLYLSPLISASIILSVFLSDSRYLYRGVHLSRVALCLFLTLTQMSLCRLRSFMYSSGLSPALSILF